MWAEIVNGKFTGKTFSGIPKLDKNADVANAVWVNSAEKIVAGTAAETFVRCGAETHPNIDCAFCLVKGLAYLK